MKPSLWQNECPQPPSLPNGFQVLEIGLDILSLERLSKVLKRSPNLFKRICAPQEYVQWTGAEGAQLAWSAALWVSKEASIKCVGTGFWRQGIDWPDLDVGSQRASLLTSTDKTERLDLQESLIWEVWHPWGLVSRNYIKNGDLKGTQLLCSVQIHQRIAWGFAYLVAPNHE